MKYAFESGRFEEQGLIFSQPISGRDNLLTKFILSTMLLQMHLLGAVKLFLRQKT